MNETKKLIQQITEGIQDKKGKNIVIADLSKIGDTICNYLVICQGNSPSQVTAIVESVREFTRKGANSKPFAIDGLRNAEWTTLTYWFTFSCLKRETSTTWNISGPTPN